MSSYSERKCRTLEFSVGLSEDLFTKQYYGNDWRFPNVQCLFFVPRIYYKSLIWKVYFTMTDLLQENVYAFKYNWYMFSYRSMLPDEPQSELLSL